MVGGLAIVVRPPVVEKLRCTSRETETKREEEDLTSGFQLLVAYFVIYKKCII